MVNTTQALGRPRFRRTTWIYALAPAIILGLLYATLIGHFRLALTFAIVVSLVGISLVRIELGIIATICFLAVLGELRRVLLLVDDWASFDPLLMIGAVMVILFFASLAARGQITFDTWTSRFAALLGCVMILQIFNPLQGGLVVGVTGAMFYLVPLLWFFVAKSTFGFDTLQPMLFRVLVPLGFIATAFGLYQTFVGYLPHQLEWYYIAGYGSLGPISALKPISFFSSSTEHAAFLSVIVVILVATAIRGQWISLIAAAIIFVSIFLVGSRGPVVRLILTFACLWAILSPSVASWIIRGSIGLVVGIAGLYWSSTQVAKFEVEGAAGFYIERQTSAFVDPLNKEESTIPMHGSMFVNGIRRGITNPLGYGLGTTTKAANKYGTRGRNAEVDLANVFISTGVVGGIFYIMLLLSIASAGIYCWRHDPSLIALCIIGILVFTAGSFLQGGKYFLSSLVWIVIGALDRRYGELRERSASP